MWIILSRIWSFITNCFKCCCPLKLSCSSTCCQGELGIENEKHEKDKEDDTQTRYKLGHFEYSYHNKNKKIIPVNK